MTPSPDLIPEISGGSIVLIGSFNPKIFQPEWFARQNLLSRTEADEADIKVIVPQVAHFETEKFVIQVTADRFIATTKANTNPALLGDLVLGTFYILEHTPITAMGLNFHMHFGMGSEDIWNHIGDRLAPKQPWSEVLEGRPGLLSMTIQSPKDSPKGALFRVKVEPSILVVPYGVYFETNEHYTAPEEKGLNTVIGILRDRWEEAQIYATKVVNHILAWASLDK